MLRSYAPEFRCKVPKGHARPIAHVRGLQLTLAWIRV